MHKLQQILVHGGLFAVVMFIAIVGCALFRLELDPSDLRNPSIYFICLVGGLLFGLLMEFAYLIPHHSIAVPLFGLMMLLVVIAIGFFQ